MPNKEILEHNRKRDIENKCLELQLELEEEGLGEDEIEQRVADLRKRLEEELAREGPASAAPEAGRGTEETHAIAERKLKQMEGLATALGLKEVGRCRGLGDAPPNVNVPDLQCTSTPSLQSKEGEAFDRELQEQRRLERQRERELRDLEQLKKLKEEKRRIRKEERKKARGALRARLLPRATRLTSSFPGSAAQGGEEGKEACQEGGQGGRAPEAQGGEGGGQGGRQGHGR